MTTGRSQISRKPPRDGEFELGQWTIEPALLRATRAGRSVQLGPKVMGVLAYLASRAGRPVSRDELLGSVWPDVVVVEGVLTRAISQLRHLFEDDPRHPQYIETIRSSGYRLIAPVRFLTAEEVALEPVSSDENSRPQRRWLLPAALVASIGAVAILAGTVYMAQREAPVPSPQPLTPTPATSWPGLEMDGALSADGEQLAFAWREGGLADPDIYVKPLDSDEAIRLTDSESDERTPVWSPDGTRVAFLRYEPSGDCSVIVMPASGGDEKTLTTRAALSADLAWSPDGRWLAFSDMATGEGPIAIFLYELASGVRRQLTSPSAANHTDFGPAFSPDSREVSFMRQVGGADRDLYVRSIESGEERRLTFDETIIAGQTWDPRGNGVVMASMRSGDWRLWQIDGRGRRRPDSRGTDENKGLTEPVLLPVGAGKVRRPSFARNVPRLVFEQRSIATEVWQMPLALGDADVRAIDVERVSSASSPIGKLERWIASSGYDHELHHSHDGRFVAFISDRSGGDQVWVARMDGSNLQRMTELESRFVGSPRWSPDDRKIVFSASPYGNMDLFLVDVATGALSNLTDDAADERVPSWSPDGESILYTSNRSGQWEIWRIPVAGGEVEQLTTIGGSVPQPANDGSSIFFVRPGLDGVWNLSGNGAEPELVIDNLTSCDAWGGWSVTQGGIYFVLRGGQGATIARLDLTTKRIKVVFHDPEMSSETIPCQMRTLDVARDESRIALSRIGRHESDILWVDVP